MGLYDRDYAQQPTYTSAVGAFATRVYGWMTLGLAVTALVAFFIYYTGAFVTLMPYTLWMILGLFGISLAFSRMATRASFSSLATLFLGYSVLEGLFMGTIIPLFIASVGGQVVGMAFLTAAVTFGISVIYGSSTKTDLTQYSKILQMALFGLVGITTVYLILSFFAPLSGLSLLISYVGLVLFVGLTAYEAQQIRRLSHEFNNDSAVAYRASLMMALQMYLNAIMIFWYLLRILSHSSRR